MVICCLRGGICSKLMHSIPCSSFHVRSPTTPMWARTHSCDNSTNCCAVRSPMRSNIRP